MLVVAPGKDGRLLGFALFGLAQPCFPAASRFCQLIFYADRRYRRSKSVRELRAFVAWAREQSAPKLAAPQAHKAVAAA
jgi:hypothetical protein